jgi:hypothetical protein
MLRSTAFGLFFAVAGLVGCGGDEGPALVANPAHASSFGYVDVTFSGDIASLGDVNQVIVGGVPAYNLRVTPTALTVTVQGSPQPGPVLVEIDGSNGKAMRQGVFAYDPPTAGVPLSWMAFGASITMGVQSYGVEEHTQLYGMGAQIARAAGAYLALPILDSRVVPPVPTSDFNPDCSAKPGTGIDINKATAYLADPATGIFDLRRARLAWQTTPLDIAIGSSTVDDVLHGGRGNVAFLEHLVEDPTLDGSAIFTQEEVSQIQRIEQADPDLAFSADLIGNDLVMSVTKTDDLHPEDITPLATVQPMLQEMMQRLGALHGQYFIANMPAPSFSPRVPAMRARRIAAGMDTPASFDAKVKQIEDITAQYDEALTQAMAPYPNLHLVDFKAYGDAVRQSGIKVGDEQLTGTHFGGIFSLDDLHFTDTGYAAYANVFLTQIEAVLGQPLPRVDVAAVHANDALSPASLRALGFTCGSKQD